jgi:hypothetical protein
VCGPGGSDDRGAAARRGARPDEAAVEIASRTADALRALYALDTRSALVVWDMLEDGHPCPMLLGENELLHEAEQIERKLPFP